MCGNVLRLGSQSSRNRLHPAEIVEMKAKFIFLAVLLLLLSACASVPAGPSVMALPGSNKVFDQFMVDDQGCRQFASQQIGLSGANNADQNAAVKSATVGTVIGALAGAALGGRDGAAIGAGMGLLTGAAVGSDNGRAATYGSQRQYDNAYVQCMYARGHRVPVQGVLTEQKTPAQSLPPPPPPPGAPPPPPPGR